MAIIGNRLVSILFFIASFEVYLILQKMIMTKVSNTIFTPIEGQIILILCSLVVMLGYISLHIPSLLEDKKHYTIGIDIKKLTTYTLFGILLHFQYIIYFNSKLSFLLGNKYYNILVNSDSHVIASILLGYGIVNSLTKNQASAPL
ncbi:hypothetical protein [Desulfotomaculum sp. 1211_IL3151]|uniref:hypothetical protein n=1 Tax=Desulfotomaculum sp. 1211_IL3151 TaxID=3084055 RepID=UPI002FD9E6A9